MDYFGFNNMDDELFKKEFLRFLNQHQQKMKLVFGRRKVGNHQMVIQVTLRLLEILILISQQKKIKNLLMKIPRL
jgi:hypothetical protein